MQNNTIFCILTKQKKNILPTIFTIFFGVFFEPKQSLSCVYIKTILEFKILCLYFTDFFLEKRNDYNKILCLYFSDSTCHP